MPPRHTRLAALTALVGCALASTWCGGSPTAPSTTTERSTLADTTGSVPDVPGAPTTPSPGPNVPSPGGGSVWVNIFGDTGWCGSAAMPQLANLLDGLPGDILLAGDLAYMNGLLDEFRRCFDPAFGRFGSRLRATPGNHDYGGSAEADGYFTYFGDRAGPGRRGFYAFRAAAWQVLMLNSSMPIGRGSAQHAWVQHQLDQEPTACTMAVIHHPFDSSGRNGPNAWLRDIWDLLYDRRADVVVAAHDHLYERLAPMDANQRPDPARGIRSFIAGTGGAPLYARTRSAATSELVISAHGVLRLRLDPASYEWEFVGVNGNAMDRGIGSCH